MVPAPSRKEISSPLYRRFLAYHSEFSFITILQSFFRCHWFGLYVCLSVWPPSQNHHSLPCGAANLWIYIGAYTAGRIKLFSVGRTYSVTKRVTYMFSSVAIVGNKCATISSTMFSSPDRRIQVEWAEVSFSLQRYLIAQESRNAFSFRLELQSPPEPQKVVNNFSSFLYNHWGVHSFNTQA